MPLYRVRPGMTHGAQKQYKGDDVVTLTEAEATPILDKVELVSDAKRSRAGGDPRQGELVVATPGNADLRYAILNASDEELLAIPGIGEKSLEGVRAWAEGREIEKSDEEKQDEPPTGNPPGQTLPTPPVPPGAVGPATVETVDVEPLTTTETVQVTGGNAGLAAPTPPAQGSTTTGRGRGKP